MRGRDRKKALEKREENERDEREEHESEGIRGAEERVRPCVCVCTCVVYVCVCVMTERAWKRGRGVREERATESENRKP